MDKQAKNIKRKIENKRKMIEQLQASIEADQKNLDRLLNVRPEKPKPKPQYMTLDCHERAGLHNRVCENPYAKCTLHNCLLSYQDVRSRRCVMKMCKHLTDIYCEPIEAEGI